MKKKCRCVHCGKKGYYDEMINETIEFYPYVRYWHKECWKDKK